MMFFVSAIPGIKTRTTLPVPVMSAKNVSCSALDTLGQSFFGIGFGAEHGCQAISGTTLGRRTGGTDPISCSSKHVSAASLVVGRWSLPEGRFLNNPRGSDTVADCAKCGCSTELRVAGTTGTDFGGEVAFRSRRLSIFACQLFVDV
jgi:hypothetical protein